MQRLLCCLLLWISSKYFLGINFEIQITNACLLRMIGKRLKRFALYWCILMKLPKLSQVLNIQQKICFFLNYITSKKFFVFKSESLEPWTENMARRMQQKFDKYWVIYSEHEATRQIAIVRDALNGLYRIYLDKHATVSNQSMDNDSQARNTSEKRCYSWLEREGIGCSNWESKI
nr:zinc finger BED domain-containing protein RICESLEEPER 2-like [Ipomoea batatas]